MKGMNLWCSSPASTAIITSTMVLRSTKMQTSVRRNKQKNNDLRKKTIVQVNTTTRYLLSDTETPFIDWVSNSHKITTTQDQVVVLRVSLHCKACEGKVRKHISKMQGVRSFSIDREAKKVTIRGDVAPLGVLASVSKVKSAQLWSSPTPT